MGYALIWVESLATALVLVALVTAWSAWRSRAFRRWLGPVCLALLLTALAGSLLYGIGWLRFVRGLEISGFSYMLFWALVFVAGSGALLARGLLSKGTEGPRARSWSGSRLALSLAALVLLTWMTFTNMDLGVKIQLSALRAEAGAMMLAAMPPRLPDRDNAALVYQEAFAALGPSDKVPERWRAKDIWFDIAELKFDAKDKELAEFLDSQKRALTLLRKAAAMPGCWFEHDYFQSVEMLLPEIPNLRQGAYLLGLDALSRASQHDGGGALDDVAAMFGIARHLNDPTLISLVTATATEKAACKILEDVLALTPLRPQDLGRLRLDDNVSYHRLFHRACVMEESSLGLSCYTLLSSTKSSPWLRETGDPLGLAILGSPFYRVFFLQDDLAGYRRTMKQMQELARRPYHEAVTDWQIFGQGIRQQPTGLIAMMIIPAADRCAAVAAEADAARDLARLGLAMTAYQQKHGKHPEKLDDLVPGYLTGIPRDPFDGRPLRWKRAGQELLLYSVGRDLKDDGGVPWDPANPNNPSDIVFRLPKR